MRKRIPAELIQIPFTYECLHCGGDIRSVGDPIWRLLSGETRWANSTPGERLVHWPEMNIGCDDEFVDTRATRKVADSYVDPWAPIGSDDDYLYYYPGGYA